jgi:hypothetical protein
VEVDGAPVAVLEAPARQSADVDPLAVPLAPYRGREVELAVVQVPSGTGALVDWRSLSIASQRPSLARLFEDEAAFAGALTEGKGTAGLWAADAYSGRSSVKVTPQERYATRLAGLPVPIRQYPRLGEFRYLRFAWKKSGGARICLGLGHDGRWGPDKMMESQARRSFRYDAGTGGQSYGLAWRLDGAPPEDWVVVTRDLYADFGPFDLTGLWLAAPDGDYALFDHIYLGREPRHLDLISGDLIAGDPMAPDAAAEQAAGGDAG